MPSMCCVSTAPVTQYHNPQVVKANGIKGHNYGSSTKRSIHSPGPIWTNAFPSGGTEQPTEFPKGEASYSWGEPNRDRPNEYLPVGYGKIFT
ncbi:unnamed protein product, partial [Gulo gulo]